MTEAVYTDLARVLVVVALAEPTHHGNRVLWPDGAGLTLNRSLEEVSAWQT